MAAYFNGYLLLVTSSVCFRSMEVGAKMATCNVRHNPDLDNKTTGNWLFRESSLRSSASKLDCAQLCNQEPSCVTFMTNRVSRTCRLYGARITRYNALVTSVGYRSYDTCRATNAFGTICSQNSDCVLANTVCIDLTCQCDAGWCYSPNSLSCVRACVQYGDMFTKFVNSYISGNNLIALSGAQYLTPGGCGAACVNTTSFVCLSFELDYTLGKCYLQSVTPFLVSLLDFLRLLVSDTDYFQRHCKYLTGG